MEVTGATRVLAMGGGGLSFKEAELSKDGLPSDGFGRKNGGFHEKWVPKNEWFRRE